MKEIAQAVSYVGVRVLEGLLAVPAEEVRREGRRLLVLLHLHQPDVRPPALGPREADVSFANLNGRGQRLARKKIG